MPLPGGLSTFTLSFGDYNKVDGSERSFAGMQGILTVSPSIVDLSTGQVLLEPVQFYIGNDGTASVGPLVANDDPSINQGTAYTVTWQARSSAPAPPNKTFVVHVADGATVDYDKLTVVTGTVSVPSAVVSVNGRTGVVTLAASDVGADASGAAAAVLPSRTGNGGKYLTTDGTAVSWGTVSSGGLQPANNLSDVASASTARTNLGLGSAATQASSAFDAAGAATAAAAAVLPTQTGNSGKYLTTNGTAASWGTVAAGGGSTLTPTATKTATYTAAVGDLAMMNVPGGATTLNLPSAPADKSQVGYRAIGATTAVPLTVNRGGSTDTIGLTGATSATIPLADETVILQYDAPNTRWLGVANVRTQASIDARYDTRPTSSSLPGYFVDAYAGQASAATAMSGSFTSPSTVVQNHQIALDCSDLRVMLPYGWYVNGVQTAADTIMPNSTTVKVSVQYNGATWPVTFRGVRQPTCDPGGRLISDPIGGFWAKGTQLKLRVLVTTVTPSSYWVGKPATGPGISPTFTDNGFTVNADIVDSTTAATTANAADTLWGGHLIGQPTVMKPFVVGAIGDSITDGTGDTGGNGFSWLSRATNATAPLFRAARGSVTAQGVAAVGYGSLALLSGCTHAFVLLGTNDCGFNRTFAQLTADLSRIYQAATAEGAKPIGATILPRTTSTDSWATTGNQSIPAGIGYTGGASSVRSQVNAWIRAGGGGLLAGYVETADPVETARDSGIWKATYTTDGIHPATVGHTAMAAAVNLTTIAAL